MVTWCPECRLIGVRWNENQPVDEICRYCKKGEVRMKRFPSLNQVIMEPVLPVLVETRDADVNCPDCKQTARKTEDYPGRPWPKIFKNGEYMRGLQGRAICDNPECHRANFEWSYKKTTGGETRTAKCG